MIFGIIIRDGKQDLTILQSGIQEILLIILKKRDPGSPVLKMYNEHLIVTVLDKKRNLQVLCLYR